DAHDDRSRSPADRRAPGETAPSIFRNCLRRRRPRPPPPRALQAERAGFPAVRRRPRAPEPSFTPRRASQLLPGRERLLDPGLEGVDPRVEFFIVRRIVPVVVTRGGAGDGAAAEERSA